MQICTRPIWTCVQNFLFPAFKMNKLQAFYCYYTRGFVTLVSKASLLTFEGIVVGNQTQ